MPLNADTPYADVAAYREVLDDATASHDDARILAELLTASELIDYMTGGRFFDQDASSVTRRYDWLNGGRALRIDDLSATPSTVSYKVGSAAAVTVGASTYTLCPRNASLASRPYTEIWFDTAPPRNAVVSISGQWGWPSVPHGVKSATIQLASIVLLDGPRGTQLVTNILADATNQLPQAVADLQAQIVNQFYRTPLIGLSG
ncbi:MAG: hypothetical protein OXQ29_11925 [Rhodospirillaceae bacterium]|nr:hypothetical protein [Rhodospirillaceae bacterium]